MGKKKITTFFILIMSVLAVITASGCSKRTVYNGLTVYNDDCLTGEYLCKVSTKEGTTYEDFLKNRYDFDWVKQKNNLPADTTLDSVVPMQALLAVRNKIVLASK